MIVVVFSFFFSIFFWSFKNRIKNRQKWYHHLKMFSMETCQHIINKLFRTDSNVCCTFQSNRFLYEITKHILCCFSPSYTHLIWYTAKVQVILPHLMLLKGIFFSNNIISLWSLMDEYSFIVITPESHTILSNISIWNLTQHNIIILVSIIRA